MRYRVTSIIKRINTGSTKVDRVMICWNSHLPRPGEESSTAPKESQEHFSM